MSHVVKQKLSSPTFVMTLLGTLASVAILVWFIQKIRANSSTVASNENNAEKKTMFSDVDVVGAHATDVGRDTYCLTNASAGGSGVEPINVSLNLPAPIQAVFSPEINLPGGQWGATNHALQVGYAERQKQFNSADVNIDTGILGQWASHESEFQNNTTPKRNGQFWAKNWEAWGPLDPFTPRYDEAGDKFKSVTPGPTDPQLAYANALVASMDDQERKFAVTENMNDVTYKYRNQLQQIPGSHFETFAASWDAHHTPMVVNRRAHLPQTAARWVVARMNEELRKEHPCFSLAGREHFEISNPPMSCGGTDGNNQKNSPITLIRVFESRLLKQPDQQLLFLTMEVGNHISGGAGGMFHTVVTIDGHGNFVDYTVPKRDEKQTFVLPRTRTGSS